MPRSPFRWVTLLPVLFWTGFVLLPLLTGPPGPPRIPKPDTITTERAVLFNLLVVGLFYLNINLLIPRVLERRGVAAYAFVTAGALVLLTGIGLSIQWLVAGQNGADFQGGMFRLVPAIFILSISTTYKVLTDVHRRQQQQQEAENGQLRSELAFLRSQISPHFLFNVLNSIVSLARLRPEAVEPVTIKLADLMRYMLYESDEKTVTVEREVLLLKSFVDIEQMRVGPKVQVQFETNLPEGHRLIEPMLLIPFVENAFKHGVGQLSDPVVQIQLYSDGSTLHLVVKNKRRPATLVPNGSPSGIGLRNVTRRLELLYPDQHQLTIEQPDGWYVTRLTLFLR